MSDTPIYDALVRKRTTTLIAELDVSALFADGTRNGEFVPLADFTRLRIAKALRDAAVILTLFTDRAACEPPIIHLTRKEPRCVQHAPGPRSADDPVADQEAGDGQDSCVRVL